jgi:hypothetical protein
MHMKTDGEETGPGGSVHGETLLLVMITCDEYL